MKKFACILGIILSLALISLGVYILADESMPIGDFSGLTVSSTSFGADFYTYSYKATRAAANNVDSLGDFIEDVSVLAVGGGFTIVGVFGLLLSFYGIGAANTAKRQTELLQQIASKQFTATVTVPAAPAAAAPARENAPARPAAAAPAREAAPARAAAPVAQNGNGERWTCANCKHSNPARLSSCDICGTHRDAVKPAAPAAKPAAPAAPAAKPAATWCCPICAMDNADNAATCICCGEKKPAAKG